MLALVHAGGLERCREACALCMERLRSKRALFHMSNAVIAMSSHPLRWRSARRPAGRRGKVAQGINQGESSHGATQAGGQQGRQQRQEANVEHKHKRGKEGLQARERHGGTNEEKEEEGEAAEEERSEERGARSEERRTRRISGGGKTRGGHSSEDTGRHVRRKQR